MTVSRDQQSTSGFSLIEMIAALSIFIVGVLVLMEVITVGLQSASTSRGYTHACLLAQLTLEETLAEGDLSFTSQSGDFTGYPGYAWTRKLEEMDEGDLHALDVTVTWNERGREKQFMLTTLVADRY